LAKPPTTLERNRALFIYRDAAGEHWIRTEERRVQIGQDWKAAYAKDPIQYISARDEPSAMNTRGFPWLSSIRMAPFSIRRTHPGSSWFASFETLESIPQAQSKKRRYKSSMIHALYRCKTFPLRLQRLSSSPLLAIRKRSNKDGF
jgi:hypothetical protein